MDADPERPREFDSDPANPFLEAVGTGTPGPRLTPVSPLETDPPAGALLAALGRLARDTRRALRLALLGRGERLPVPVQRYLEGTLNHLGQVREGFALSLRPGDCRSPSELRDLVEELLVDWDWMGRLGIRWVPLDQPLEKPLAQVLAYAHARAALGALPRVPEAHVTYPALRRSYADIPVPRSPGEVLERLDEIERVVATTLHGGMEGGGRPGRSGGANEQPARPRGEDRLSMNPVAFRTPALRRAYGFFETSAWLVEQLSSGRGS